MSNYGSRVTNDRLMVLFRIASGVNGVISIYIVISIACNEFSYNDPS